MTVQTVEKPQRLVRHPTSPGVRPAASQSAQQATDSAFQPIESIVADLEGAPRYLVPLIALGVIVVGAIAVIAFT